MLCNHFPVAIIFHLGYSGADDFQAKRKDIHNHSVETYYPFYNCPEIVLVDGSSYIDDD